MSQNPFDPDYVEPTEGVAPVVLPEKDAQPDKILITKPGAYPDIDNEDYHRNPMLLPGPSLSSSGAKKLASASAEVPGSSAYHFWFDSPMNPNRPPERTKSHFNIGKAAHDLILLPDRWAEHYHTLPEGFNAAHSTKWEEAIHELELAIDAGKTILRFTDGIIVQRTAEAIRKNDLAMATLTGGVTEETLVWQDPHTGVWLRARPDFRPESIVMKRPVMVVSDLKFMAPTFCSPSGFERAIDNFGYHQTAAFYADGIREIYGHYPTHWVHVVVEKPATDQDPLHAPYSVSLYELPREDIERGRLLNRRAINLFAHCLKSQEWPSYADKEPKPVGLPYWARSRIDDATPEEYAYADASRPNGDENE